MNSSSASHDWRSLSDLEREREYSPSSCIGGNYRPFIDAYHAHSALALSSTSKAAAVWTEERYGSAEALRIRLCRKPSQHDAPLLVFIHGGYWQELSAAASLFPADRCLEAGAAFAAIDYTLAPQASIGEIVEECRSALLWLAGNAQRLGLDPSKIVVAGSSAGAHLAAMACLPTWRSRLTSAFTPAGAILVSGIFDLEPLVGTSINAALGLDACEARKQSPAFESDQGLVGFPSTSIFWGENETQAFKQQGQSFAQKLLRAGTACTAEEIEARNHFDIILDLADSRSQIWRATTSLLLSESEKPLIPRI